MGVCASAEGECVHEVRGPVCPAVEVASEVGAADLSQPWSGAQAPPPSAAAVAAAAAAAAATRNGQARPVLPVITEADLSVREHAIVESLGGALQTTDAEPQPPPAVLDYDAMFSPSNAEYATYCQSWHHMQKEYSAPATPRSLSAAASPQQQQHQQQTISISESMLSLDLDGAATLPGQSASVLSTRLDSQPCTALALLRASSRSASGRCTPSHMGHVPLPLSSPRNAALPRRPALLDDSVMLIPPAIQPIAAQAAAAVEQQQCEPSRQPKPSGSALDWTTVFHDLQQLKETQDNER